MYEIIFGSRRFCGFLKFRPNLRKFMTFKIWKAPFERKIFWFPLFGKVDAIFVVILRFFSGYVVILCYFPPKPLQSLCPRNIWFWPIHKSKFLMKRVSFCHSRKFIPKISQSFRKSFCRRKVRSLCPKVSFFSIYLLLTYDYLCNEMSFMPYSITNSIKIIKCGYTVILRMLE